MRKKVLPASCSAPRPNAQEAAAPLAQDDMEITVVLRRSEWLPPLEDDVESGLIAPHRRHHATHEDLAARYGPDAAALDVLEQFARRHGLDVLDHEPGARSVVVVGPHRAFEKAFGITFTGLRQGGRVHRGFTGRPRVPAELAEAVEAVIGLDNRPLRPEFPRAMAASPRVLSANELATFYRYPEAFDGRGQTIGIIALAGGYHASDVESLFKSLGRTPPEIVDVNVHESLDRTATGTNRPASPEALGSFSSFLRGAGGEATPEAIATFETTMDVQIAASLAPGARIAVYFAPSDDEQGLYSALAAALRDTRLAPSVLSLSWGWLEPELLSPGRVARPSSIVTAINGLLLKAAHLGVTVCIASGDDASCDERGVPSVQFPSSSPYALACGGTSLRMKGDALADEVVWSAMMGGRRFATTGGGSRLFPRPVWQAPVARRVPRPGRKQARGVPDVAAVADRELGCRIVVGGRTEVASGTSAAAPAWAALVARLNSALDARLGWINPWLYRHACGGSCVRPIVRGTTEGGNGHYQAGCPWNPCTGLGSPIGDALLATLNET